HAGAPWRALLWPPPPRTTRCRELFTCRSPSPLATSSAYSPYESRHHSPTLPSTSCRPNPVGGDVPIGACDDQPSCFEASCPGSRGSKSPMLITPSQSSACSPVHKIVVVPARSAYSHCASVGSASPSRRHVSLHSNQLTSSTGCSSGF